MASIGTGKRPVERFSSLGSGDRVTLPVVSLGLLVGGELLERKTRALGVCKQAVLVLRWFIDGARLARDNGVSLPTSYRHLHEGLTVLADHAPDLSTARERAAAAGYTHLDLDGTVIRGDRVAAPGPNGADLWWSGKHKHHGRNVRVISARTARTHHLKEGHRTSQCVTERASLSPAPDQPSRYSAESGSLAVRVEGCGSSRHRARRTARGSASRTGSATSSDWTGIGAVVAADTLSILASRS